MLTKAEIEKLSIIQEADLACFDETNYNLRLGAEYVLVNDGDPKVSDCSKGILTIPPFGCALVSTHESVKIPERVYGRWGLRIRPALSGIIFQAGPQIEPGYKGRLFGLLFNLSATPYQAPYLKALWSIDFTQIGPDPVIPLTGDPLEKNLHVNYYMTEQIPRGGLADALTRFGVAQHELETLKQWITDQKVAWEKQLDGKVKEIDAKIDKDMSALQNVSTEMKAGREKDRNDQLDNVQKQLISRDALLNEAFQQLKGKQDFRIMIFAGVIVILAAALLPLAITKVTFDKDIIVPMIEEKSGTLEMTRHFTEDTTKLLNENAVLRGEISNANINFSKLREDLEALQRSSLVDTNQTGAKPAHTP